MTEKELAYIVNRDRRIRQYRNWLIGLCLVSLLSRKDAGWQRGIDNIRKPCGSKV